MGVLMSTEDKYKQVSSCETMGLGGVGVKILVKLPDGVALSDAEDANAKNVGYDLYRRLQNFVIQSDPKEIEFAKKEGEELLALFGDEKIFAEPTHNEYSSDSLRPWFIVTTKIGRIKIGWRKRVIVIDWSDSTNKGRAVDLFATDDVTKDLHMIHAWGYEKAKEYLQVLLGLSEPQRPLPQEPFADLLNQCSVRLRKVIDRIGIKNWNELLERTREDLLAEVGFAAGCLAELENLLVKFKQVLKTRSRR
jgi:hypothetical protein